jgi:hypothetical protein
MEGRANLIDAEQHYNETYNKWHSRIVGSIDWY